MQYFILLLPVLMQAAAASEKAIGPGVFINGDILLGGLFPISSLDCRTIKSQIGIQRMEAMIFSLMQANSDQGLLKYGRHKIRLGGLLFDTCSRESTALERALDFVKSSLSYDLGHGFVCPMPNGSLAPAVRVAASGLSGGSSAVVGRIRGVVGGAYSQVSVQVANLLRLFAVPQISYASTSAALSDKTRFELFARTVPSDTEQARALADIVAYFNWTYVSTVFSKGDYGEGGIQSFEAEATKLGVCIADRLVIDQEPTRHHLDSMVERLNLHSRVRVVVLFTRQDHTELFLNAVSRANLSLGRFQWVSADGWGRSDRPVRNNSLVANGALTLEVATSEIPGFNHYFTSLRPEKTQSASYNRYFNEFWQQNFNCFLDDNNESSAQRGGARAKCNDTLHIALDQFKQEPKVQFVYDAVFTFVHGIEKVMKSVCSNQNRDVDTKANGLFDQCVKNISSYSGKDLYSILIGPNNLLNNTVGRAVKFNKFGDGIVPYSIYNYQFTSENGQQKYTYKAVGKWIGDAGLKWLVDKKIAWPGGVAKPPASSCSDDCAAGQRAVFHSKSRCCWSCIE